MTRLRPDEIVSRLKQLFEEWFPTRRVDVASEVEAERSIFDFSLRLGNIDFHGEFSNRGDLAAVEKASSQLLNSNMPVGTTPLLVVPYMGDSGAKRCEKQGISWVDLSGNAHIESEHLLVHVEGKPNQYRQAGSEVNPFAPKSSRVARFLLQHPAEAYSQKEIVEQTDLGKSYVSKVVNQLQKDRLVERDKDRRIRVRDPDLLLDAWYEQYDFSKHRIIKGTVAAKHSARLVDELTLALRERDQKFAATGLAAAWLMTQFARFRITTFYTETAPSEEWKRNLGLREDPRGANVWLVVPKDEGVFHGLEDYEGVPCVHPVQTYVDLKAHPERSDEAAESIRTDILKWKTNE